MALTDQRETRSFKSDAEKRFNRIEGELGNIRGELFESRFARNYGQMLGRRFRNIRPLVLSDFQPVNVLLEQGKLTFRVGGTQRSDALMLVREQASPAPWVKL